MEKPCTRDGQGDMVGVHVIATNPSAMVLSCSRRRQVRSTSKRETVGGCVVDINPYKVYQSFTVNENIALHVGAACTF